MNFCKAKNWMWELQGPQIPHMNVLGLDCFTEMPRHHIHFIWYLRVMIVAKQDWIWKIAAKVWEELPS